MRRPGGWKPLKPIKPKAAAKPIKPAWPKNLYEAGENKNRALQALESGRCLTFNYHGLPRVVGVFTVGLSQAGRPSMSAWQVDGQSQDQTIPCWGTFCFDECFDVSLSNIPSPSAPADYSKGAKQFKFIEREF